MVAKSATAQLLHVPHKNWTKEVAEKQNYDEIERWSQKIPRGQIATGQTNSVVGGIVPGALYEAVQTPPISFEIGRQYKIMAIWPGIQSPVVGDIAEFKIALLAQTGSIAFGHVNLWNTEFHRIDAANVYHSGGVIFAYVNPDKNLNGPFICQLLVGCTGTGPIQVKGLSRDPNNPPQLNGVGQVIAITVEDLGARS